MNCYDTTIPLTNAVMVESDEVMVIIHEDDFNGTSLSECCVALWCFLPEYLYLYTRGEPGPCSRLAHARNVVVCGDACAFKFTTPNLRQPRLYRTNEVLSNLPCFALWVVGTTQTF